MNIFFLIYFAFSTHIVYALAVGNPNETIIFQFNPETSSCHFLSYGIGFYGDYVFNRNLQTDPGKDIDTTKIFTNAGYLVICFKERAELFATLGTSRLCLNTSLTAFNHVDPFPLFELDSGSAFSYSIGGKATVLRYKCAAFGIQGQYFSTKPNIKRVYIAAGAVSYLDNSLTTDYSEWQVGGGISYRYNPFFIPYISVKYSRAWWELANGKNIVIESNTNTFFFNLHSQRNWGYAVGLTLCPYFDDKLAVTIEARFLDEKACYINGQIRF